jgi:enoyl-CoA hydratase/carnithine racemase
MDAISVEYREGVAILVLNRGVTNSISFGLINEFNHVLQSAKDDASVRGLVMSSNNNKFFSIGFDIPSLYDLPQDDFTDFYKAFNRMCIELYTLPKPTVAAITGHAVAGGCILALCCDSRVIAEGKKLIGLNEIKLGVPVPYPADCILRSTVGARYAREIMETGEFYPPDDLLRMGLVDQVMPLERVTSEAIEITRVLGSLPGEAFAIIKHNRVEDVVQVIQKRLEEKEGKFVECWYSDQARTFIKEAMEKF